MWAKATTWVLLAGAAAAGGCAMMTDHGFFPSPARKEEPTKYDRQALIDFDNAVVLATDLKYAEAEAKLSQLLPIFEAASDHRRSAETMFWLGYCNEKQGRRARAMSFYERVVKDYSDSRASREAGRRLAVLESLSSP